MVVDVEFVGKLNIYRLTLIFLFEVKLLAVSLSCRGVWCYDLRL